ncbi:hypothetical protein BJ878DRAFT_539536 [Calycina marina]|uniref:Zn(2)-C6 fungal-type domain-containing protein n=1 Tax=Calycina marina TaxID=1763456 RepID=A0A9P7Z933_9HELO|nr:hypothetical protein BJ878DRAFT_539536 [Calycina marina]
MDSGPGGSNGTGQLYTTSGQPHHSPIFNSEELQLTAQISRHTAPNINIGSGTNTPDGHERQLRSPSHGYDQQALIAAQQAHLHAAKHAANEGLEHMGGYQHGGQGDGSRKRSKVSRACDECRRKKIRCDSIEGHDEDCSGCKRIGRRCEFTRQPMKRGPSKGYIKELSDRVNRLENVHGVEGVMATQYSPTQSTALDAGSGEELGAVVQPEAGHHKRTYSSILRDFGVTYGPTVPDTDTEAKQVSQRSLNPFQLPPNDRQEQFDDQPYEQSAMSQNQFQSVYQECVPRRQIQSRPDALAMDSPVVAHGIPMNMGQLDKYYRMIHVHLPILHSKVQDVAQLLTKCDVVVMQSFNAILAITTTTMCVSSVNEIQLDDRQGSAKPAISLLIDSEYVDTPATSLANKIVRLQSWLLLILEADYRGPGRIGLPLSRLISHAFGVAAALNTGESIIGKNESDEGVARRNFLILSSIERWSSIKQPMRLRFGDESLWVDPGEEHVLTDNIFQLSRLSGALALLMAAAASASDTPDNRRAQLHVLCYRQQALVGVKRVEEGVPWHLKVDYSAAPVLHLTYSIVLLLCELENERKSVMRLSNTAGRIVDMVKAHPELADSPFAHYAAGLAALVLLGLSRHDLTKESANADLTTMMRIRVAPIAWDHGIKQLIRRERPNISTETSAASAQASMASQGLQLLATASSGEIARSQNFPPALKDLASLLRGGFANKFL